jgi:hypothetical protein
MSSARVVLGEGSRVCDRTHGSDLYEEPVTESPQARVGDRHLASRRSRPVKIAATVPCTGDPTDGYVTSLSSWSSLIS